MDCQHTTERIQAWLDGTLADDERAALHAHLAECPHCRAESEEWQALQHALRNLPAPAPPADLTERLWAEHPRRHHPGWIVAAAASLVLALLVGPFLIPGVRDAAEPEQRVASVQLPVDGSETVQLSLSSPRDLQQVQLTLVLPEHLALEGHPGQRVIRWKTDLLAGANRLSLPLKARGSGDGEFITRIQYGDESEEMRVRVTTSTPPSGQSRRESMHSFTLARQTTFARSHDHA